MNPLHLYWIIPLFLYIGGQITSIVEYRLKYNLTDEELDVLKGLFSKASTAEKNVIAKVGRLLRKAEFWKKAN